jgi:hypothetical protein
MKLRDIIKQIDYLCEVKILQTDAYLETSEHYGEEEEIYVGSALNVPWYIVDMYLDGENCISVVDNKMIIYVKEDINNYDRKRT